MTDIKTLLDKLEENILDHTNGFWGKHGITREEFEEALNLYIEERERLARIGELKRLTDHQQNTQDMEREQPGYSFEVVSVTPIYDRIKELEGN